MQRTLLSGGNWFNKITVLVIPIATVAMVIESKVEWDDIKISFAIVLALVELVLLYSVFSPVHPVYFDDNAIVWGNKENQRTVPFLEIERIVRTYNYRQGDVCRMKYYDEQQRVRFLRFTLSRPVDSGDEKWAELFSKLPSEKFEMKRGDIYLKEEFQKKLL